jgi:hypothetical protein
LTKTIPDNSWVSGFQELTWLVSKNKKRIRRRSEPWGMPVLIRKAFLSEDRSTGSYSN